MFEKELADKFKAIFDVKDVSYDNPGESQEQEKLWVSVETPKFTFADKKVKAIVTGSAIMFGRNDALTFGYLSQCISKASNALTKDLFFSDFESNTLRFRDKVQRGFNFTYFFNSQFDPDVGTIESVTINTQET